MDIWVKLKAGVIAFGSAIAFWMGGLDLLLMVLTVMMALDFLTGLAKGIHNQTLSSEVCAKGIIRKVVMLIIVALAFLIEEVTGGTFPLREIVIMFFIANEGISILENAAAMGLPIPAKIKDTLIQLKGRSTKEKEKFEIKIDIKEEKETETKQEG